MIEIHSKIRYAQISPKKVKPLLKDLRGKLVNDVFSGLKYSPSKAGKLLFKLISSAVANAENNYNIKPEDLKIKKIVVDSGPQYKRYWLRSHGSSDVRLKRTAHIATSLEALVKDPEKVKPTKSKSTKVSGESIKNGKTVKPKTKLTSDTRESLKGKTHQADTKTIPRTTNK